MKLASAFRMLFCIALLTGVTTLSAAPRDSHAQETDFLAGFADLPLMPGLSAVEDAGLVFDSPSGRIAEAYATGLVAREAVTAFYRDTLPALGWERQADNRFVREGEELTIDFFEGGTGTTVRFTTAPAQGG